jgi:hypothetical protein
MHQMVFKIASQYMFLNKELTLVVLPIFVTQVGSFSKSSRLFLFFFLGPALDPVVKALRQSATRW